MASTSNWQTLGGKKAPHSLVTLKGGAEGHGGRDLVDDESMAPNRQTFPQWKSNLVEI